MFINPIRRLRVKVANSYALSTFEGLSFKTYNDHTGNALQGKFYSLQTTDTLGLSVHGSAFSIEEGSY